MAVFKTLDLRGLPFTNGFDLALRELKRIRIDGILEIIMDKKRNFTGAFRKWAAERGHKVSDIDDDNRMVRVFIQKGRQNVS